MRRISTHLVVLMSLLPWFWVSGLVVFALRARVLLGHWPSPAQPDPKSLPFEIHHAVLWIGFYLVSALLPFAVFVFILNEFILKRNVMVGPARIFAAGGLMILPFVFVFHGSWNWVEWFLD